MLAAVSAVMRNSEKPVFSLRCMHIEHGIRPAAESLADAEFVRELCARFNVPLKIVTVPPGKIAARAGNIGIEAAARFFRRKALFQEARKIEAEGCPVRILVGHTKDDMLETALMRVLRGAGPAGLAIMPESRGRILRPLLSLRRADVLNYLAAKNIRWREDSTNTDTGFLRNRIRHSLVPLLDESFPFWKSGTTAMAQTQALTADFIRDEAQKRVKWERETGKLPSPSLITGAEVFFSQPEIIREEALFLGIDLFLAGGEKNLPVKRSVLRRFCSGLVIAADLGPLRIKRDGGRVLLLGKRDDIFERGFSLLIKEPGLYTLKRTTIEVSPFIDSGNSVGFCASLPIVFRPCFKDDSLVTAGRTIKPKDLVKSRKRLISAADRFGIAAFIRAGEILAKRPESGQTVSVLIKTTNSNTGGMDV